MAKPNSLQFLCNPLVFRFLFVFEAGISDYNAKSVCLFFALNKLRINVVTVSTDLNIQHLVHVQCTYCIYNISVTIHPM